MPYRQYRLPNFLKTVYHFSLRLYLYNLDSFLHNLKYAYFCIVFFKFSSELLLWYYTLTKYIFACRQDWSSWDDLSNTIYIYKKSCKSYICNSLLALFPFHAQIGVVYGVVWRSFWFSQNPQTCINTDFFGHLFLNRLHCRDEMVHHSLAVWNCQDLCSQKNTQNFFPLIVQFAVIIPIILRKSELV